MLIITSWIKVFIAVLAIILPFLGNFNCSGDYMKSNPHKDYYSVAGRLQKLRYSVGLHITGNTLYVWGYENGIEEIDLNGKKEPILWHAVDGFSSTSAEIGGKIYMIGQHYTDSEVQEFDTRTKKYRRKLKSMHQMMQEPWVFKSIDNKLLVAGGYYEQDVELEELDINTFVGVQKAKFLKKINHVLTVLESSNKLFYIVTEMTGKVRFQDGTAVKVYSIDKNSYEIKEMMTLGDSNDYYYRRYFLDKNLIYMIGGRTERDSIPQKIIKEINIETKEIITSDMSLKIRRSGGDILKLKDGRLLVTGGDSSGHYLKGHYADNTMELLDFKTKKSMLIAMPNRQRDGCKVTQLKNGDLLLVGGYHDPDGETKLGFVREIHRFDYNRFIKEVWDKN